MHSCRVFIISLLAFSLCPRVEGAEPPLVSGVWRKGHNITEPRPKSSTFMKVLEGGFLVLPTAAVYRLQIEISPNLSTPYFMQALFENPLDRSKPFTEQTVVSRPDNNVTLTHGPVKGLRISGDYRITVKIFRHKGDAEPIDVLEQKVRSYVDTKGAAIKMKSGMNLR
jgi:hypothetical protein